MPSREDAGRAFETSNDAKNGGPFFGSVRGAADMPFVVSVRCGGQVVRLPIARATVRELSYALLKQPGVETKSCLFELSDAAKPDRVLGVRDDVMVVFRAETASCAAIDVLLESRWPIGRMQIYRDALLYVQSSPEVIASGLHKLAENIVARQVFFEARALQLHALPEMPTEAAAWAALRALGADPGAAETETARLQRKGARAHFDRTQQLPVARTPEGHRFTALGAMAYRDFFHFNAKLVARVLASLPAHATSLPQARGHCLNAALAVMRPNMRPLGGGEAGRLDAADADAVDAVDAGTMQRVALARGVVAQCREAGDAERVGTLSVKGATGVLRKFDVFAMPGPVCVVRARRGQTLFVRADAGLVFFGAPLAARMRTGAAPADAPHDSVWGGVCGGVCTLLRCIDAACLQHPGLAEHRRALLLQADAALKRQQGALTTVQYAYLRMMCLDGSGAVHGLAELCGAE